MSNQVATTIKAQIGVGALMRMGAHRMRSTDHTFQFKVGGKRQTYVDVTLNGRDLYDVTMFRMVNYDSKTLARVDNVYADQLERTVLVMTGEMDPATVR